MSKIQITIWATAEEIAMVDNKITVKTGSFYYNNKKYMIENGEIKTTTTEQIPF
jgi:hypothetical protein